MIRSSKIENTYLVWLNSNLNRFSFDITTVIKAINYSFFQSLIRIIVFYNRTLSILGLMDFLLDNICLEIIHRITNHLRHTTSYGRNLNHIIRVLHSSFRKYHDFNLGHFEEFLRMLTEHHRSNILDLKTFRCSFQQIHLLKNTL